MRRIKGTVRGIMKLKGSINRAIFWVLRFKPRSDIPSQTHITSCYIGFSVDGFSIIGFSATDTIPLGKFLPSDTLIHDN